MDSFNTDLFCPDEPGLFKWIHDAILEQGDVYFHLADLPSYCETHDRATGEYADRAVWCRKAILNVARIGRFSSDRTVREYSEDIWDVGPVT